MKTYSTSEIAREMSKLAPRRADVNRLRGVKLLEYKRLELDFLDAKFSEDTYSGSTYILRGEVITITAEQQKADAFAMYSDRREKLALEIAEMSGVK